MVCSHCKEPLHTYRTCPTISPEEKAAKKTAIEEKKKLATQRKNKRNERIKQNIENNKVTTYEVQNSSNSDMVLYWGYTNGVVINRFAYVTACSSLIFNCVKQKHIIVFFPFHEVQINNTNETIKQIPIEYVNNDMTRRTYPYIHNIDICMKDFEGLEITLIGNYKIQKSMLEKWMECALKSKFLLDQIHLMTGGGTTLKEYENIEPFMDMVEDIIVPECSEFDKEKSGVPSELTNAY